MIVAFNEYRFLGPVVYGVTASCDGSSVLQSGEVKVGVSGETVFQLRQEGEEVSG